MTVRCKHNRTICAECVKITDSAKRLSDAINLILSANDLDEVARSWIAVALMDGSTDYTLYPSRQLAINHQANEFHFTYLNLRNCLNGMSQKDAQLWLDVHRHAYDNGLRLSDPDTPDLIFPQAKEQHITRPIFPVIDPLKAFRRR
jgi:hypothetical protein